MLTRLTHLALEVADLDAARAFYADRFGLPADRTTDREAVVPVGGTDLRLRRPGPVPRGGLHTHFALSGTPGSLAAWRERLADLDPEAVEFGASTSLYVFDPDDNCVEVGCPDGEDGPADAPTGVFEVVLEVAALDDAVETYAALGFEAVDRGTDRRRIRLDGPVALELWEPHVGLAGGRGGVHVDLGFATADPTAAADAVADRTTARVALADGVRVRDADGHWLTFRRA
jgi:catechol-2,3-dioxygenase